MSGGGLSAGDTGVEQSRWTNPCPYGADGLLLLPSIILDKQDK